MKANKLDLTKITKSKSKQWIALSPHSNKVIGQASTLKKVLQVARKSKIGNPTVFKIGQFSSSFVG